MYENHIVVITGAASGIGKATAQEFVDRGATVIGVDVNEAGLRAGEQELGERFRGRVCNLGSVEEIRGLARGIQQEYGRVDVLVNAAGFLRTAPMSELEERDWDLVTGVMLKGPLFLIQAIAPLMREAPDACIINFGSAGAMLRGAAGASLYGLAKSGMVELTYFCVSELPWIRTNAVLPGPIQTPIFTRGGTMTDDAAVKMFEHINNDLIPVRRPGTPQDVANLIAFLCSEEASFINGAAIPVDGGFLSCQGGFLKQADEAAAVAAQPVESEV